MKQRMAYCYPEQTRVARDEQGQPIKDRNGRMIEERIPNHPIRPARPTDASTWWQDAEDSACN